MAENDKREFERHLNNFLIEVHAKDEKGIVFQEKTMLQDISGSGGSFATEKKENYFIGQLVKINIYLPGKMDIKAKMGGTGTVVRITPFSTEADSREKKSASNIAVSFEAPITLQRDE